MAIGFNQSTAMQVVLILAVIWASNNVAAIGSVVGKRA